jgi:hypothetical protein
MFIDELSDQEVGMLIVALKYWRTHRLDTATRRTDPALTRDAVDLLLAKLEIASASLSAGRDVPTGFSQR